MKLVAIAVALACVSLVAAHGRLTFPTPREAIYGPLSAGSAAIFKFAPFDDTTQSGASAANQNSCGGSDNQMGTGTNEQGMWMEAFEPGESINVQWLLTAAHGNCHEPGVRIAIQYGDGTGTGDDFDSNVIASDVFANVTTGGTGTTPNTGNNTYTVTLPATKTAPVATLQWIWGQDSDGGYYIGCADICIGTDEYCANGGGGTTSGSTGVAPVAAIVAAIVAMIAALF